MKHSDGLLIIDTKSDLMPTCQWKTILMHFFGNESDICDWTNEIWSEGKKSWKFREKKKAASYNFNWKKGNLTQKGGWGGKGKTILLISHTLRVVIRLKISIMGLKRTFYHPFVLSYLSFNVIINYLWFSFDDLVDLIWCELYWNSSKTLNRSPLPLDPTLMCF